MKLFTKSEIEGVKKYCEGKRYREVHAMLGSHEFSYFIMSQSENPELPYFVLRATGRDISDGEVYGIADSVPEKFQNYPVAHEVIEFRKIGIDSPDRCVRALGEELLLVPQDIKQEYMLMRRDFFRSLIMYASQHPDDFTSEDIAEFNQSLERLEMLTE